MALVYVEEKFGTLTAAQVTSLRNLVGQLWDGQAAKVDFIRFYVQNGRVEFQLQGRKSAVEADFPVGLTVVGRE